MTTLHLIIHLHDTLTGEAAIWRTTETRQETETREEQVGLIRYMWSDGNYGCDCNRRLFLDRAQGREVEVGAYPCSERRVVVDCIMDDETGELLYRDEVKAK